MQGDGIVSTNWIVCYCCYVLVLVPHYPCVTATSTLIRPRISWAIKHRSSKKAILPAFAHTTRYNSFQKQYYMAEQKYFHAKENIDWISYVSFKVIFEKSAFCTATTLKTISCGLILVLVFFLPKTTGRFNVCKREGTIVRGNIVNGGTCLQMRSRQDSGNRPNIMKANNFVFSPTPFIATFLWRHNTVW